MPLQTIVRARPEHISDCVEAVLDSAIGCYFHSEESAILFMEGAMTSGDLWVGLSEDGDVLGLVKQSLQGGFHRFPYIHVFAIRHPYRGQGVGRELLLGFEREMLAAHSKVLLLVSDFNTSAQSFYKNNGYVEVGRIPDFYMQGITELIMVKSLEGGDGAG